MDYTQAFKDWIFIFTLSIVYAWIELEIEGGRQNNIVYSSGSRGGIGGSRYTLYHIYMLIFLAVMVLAIFTRESFNFKTLLTAAFYFILILLIEDVSWFIFNARAGGLFKSYNKDFAHWHTNWIGPIPAHNLIGLALACIPPLLLMSMPLFTTIFMSIAGIILMIALSPLYFKFYNYMHNKYPSKSLVAFQE